MNRIARYVVPALAALVLGAWGVQGKEPVRLKIAYSPSLCQAPLHIAVEKGFFAREGIQAENIQVDAAHVQEAIGSGQVDVGAGLISKFLQPVENGLPIRFVFGVHRGCIHVLAPKDSPLTGVAQLKGKRVGVPGLADAATLILKRALTAEGVSVDIRNAEVEFVVYERNDLAQALEKGLVDAIALGDPQASIVADRLHLVSVLDTAQTAPFDAEYCCAIFLTAKFAKEHPEQAAAVTRALLKASAWVKEHPEETAQIQVEKKYVAGDAGFNAKLLRSYNYRPSVRGGYDAVKLNAEQLAAIGILKRDTDAKAFADRVFLFQEGVPDSYAADDVANVN